MHTTLHFTKASGAGNDFVILDAVQGAVPADRGALARAVCDRRFGIGADGLLVVARDPRADFRMEYFNSDGSTGGMCGNGGRCVARYAFLRGYVCESHRFVAFDYLYDAIVTGASVRLHMKEPESFRTVRGIRVGDRAVDGWFVNTGSPHFVTVVDDLETVDVMGLGRALRRHEEFMPAGTNVNFVRIDLPSRIEQRTYERGVEDETLACGTGSVASAVVGATSLNMSPPIGVRVRSGEVLTVHCTRGQDQPARDVWLEGSAHMVFTGSFGWDPDAGAIVDGSLIHTARIP